MKKHSTWAEPHMQTYDIHRQKQTTDTNTGAECQGTEQETEIQTDR